MTSKSKVKSMQRGAQKSNRRKYYDTSSDYKDFNPRLRPEDSLCLGVSTGNLANVIQRTEAKVAGYVRAGFTKPSDISRLLNKDNIRTAADTYWTPRLVWFLKKYLNISKSKNSVQIKPKKRARAPDKILKSIDSSVDMKIKLEQLQNKFK